MKIVAPDLFPGAGGLGGAPAGSGREAEIGMVERDALADGSGATIVVGSITRTTSFDSTETGCGAVTFIGGVIEAETGSWR